jgi:outer membrane protein assembly factor BamD
VLAKSYDKLGLVQLADDSRAILKRTFPTSVYIAGVPAAKPWWKFW